MLPENRPLEKLALTTSTGSWSPSRAWISPDFLNDNVMGKSPAYVRTAPSQSPTSSETGAYSFFSDAAIASRRFFRSAANFSAYPGISAERMSPSISQGSRQNLFAAAAMTIPSPGSIRIFAAAPPIPPP